MKNIKQLKKWIMSTCDICGKEFENVGIPSYDERFEEDTCDECALKGKQEYFDWMWQQPIKKEIDTNTTDGAKSLYQKMREIRRIIVDELPATYCKDENVSKCSDCINEKMCKGEIRRMVFFILNTGIEKRIFDEICGERIVVENLAP